MLSRSSRSRNFFRKLVVNGVSNSKAAIQNDCLMRLYDADAELKAISSELDSFDGKKDPIRCNLLVNQLRTAQDKVISLLFQLMDDCSCERASRDYRMKFPDEILLSEGSESLNGQIWFGAECLSAGSNILNHNKESTMLRPMAKTLTTHLDSLRNDLRDLVISGGGASRINQALIKKMVAFDHIFATFEYEYVRTMLPIRTVAEIEKLQEVAVLFSEALIDCVKRGLIKQDDIDEFQPIVMIAIPRLAIVRGLLYKNENPIYTRHKSQMCCLFQPFHGPLHSIRRLLRGLSPNELLSLERMLANDQTAIVSPLTTSKQDKTEIEHQQNEPMHFSEDKTESCRCENESEAGTSNNYTNVLMNGLHYPVGQKRGVNDSESTYLQSNGEFEQQSYSCCHTGAPSSSSKSNVQARSPDNSLVGSSPSSSSSLSSTLNCKACGEKTADDICSEKQDCDKNCCLPVQETDSQLEKFITEFEPSNDNQNSDPASSNSGEGTLNCSNSILAEVKQQPTEPKIEQPAEDEALLQELFMKQAQQLLHRLFVAISGVADQLQSNFASDLRFILRHIFSSEIEGLNGIEEDNEINDDEDDSEDRDYSNNDQSDSSLPIEQGIEAQEVANLIDLESDYSLNSPYEYDQDMRFMPQAASNLPYLNNANEGDINHYSPNSSLYAQVNESETTNPRAFQDSANQNPNEEILADLMRAVDQTELIYESRSSPNETSIMDDSRHHQQLVQQHLQTLLRPNRSSSRSHRHGDGSSSQQHGFERRSRHHGHGGSRSRRPRGPPVWVPDHLVVACSCCNASFSLFRRRHHCRACGQIFCADCSKFTKNLDCWGYHGPVRVCESCFNQP